MTFSEMLDLKKVYPTITPSQEASEGFVLPNQRSNPRKNNKKKPGNRKSFTQGRKRDYPGQWWKDDSYKAQLEAKSSDWSRRANGKKKKKKKLFDIFDCAEGNLTALAESLRINQHMIRTQNTKQLPHPSNSKKKNNNTTLNISLRRREEGNGKEGREGVGEKESETERKGIPVYVWANITLQS